ncbi:hypothetical protein QFZ36_000550 [Pseudarthrobacter siccitolerans]|uniref:Uncharacterized protein n=1 Tax=Pseudarthrobacter siccitolerans TaxID=861266 RepID=A0ABU0PG93_9MICC|nr:hypothetical protein [Pseudarthrobacter siccitolerans]MDQ0672989.1 hypothetical protein [Pseudarthrobacter siccitolerans]
MAETAAGYQLAIAAGQGAGIGAEHQVELPVSPQPAPGNWKDMIASYKAENRSPTSSRSPQEKALAVWLHRRRQAPAEGSLSPAYADAVTETAASPQVTVTSAGSGDPCSMQCVTMIGYVQLSSIGDREVIGNAS